MRGKRVCCLVMSKMFGEVVETSHQQEQGEYHDLPDPNSEPLGQQPRLNLNYS